MPPAGRQIDKPRYIAVRERIDKRTIKFPTSEPFADQSIDGVFGKRNLNVAYRTTYTVVSRTWKTAAGNSIKKV